MEILWSRLRFGDEDEDADDDRITRAIEVHLKCSLDFTIFMLGYKNYFKFRFGASLTINLFSSINFILKLYFFVLLDYFYFNL